MYQKVEDPTLGTPSAGSPRALWRVRIALAAVLAIIGVGLALASFVFRSDVSDANASDPIEVQRIEYRTAISEPYAPLRRARLQDFMSTHPNSAWHNATQAQLDVLNNQEALAWAELSHVLYDPNLDNAAKRGAVTAYERAWGPSFLGGRDREIARLQKAFAESEGVLPEWTPPTRESPIPTDIADSELLGGPLSASDDNRADLPITQTVAARVIAPRVRRSVTPLYPRKALRKDIEAVVTLSLNINDAGRVEMANLVSVSASDYEKDFVRAAKRAARRTRYFPKTINGIPQPASGVVKRYRFELGD